MTDSASSGHENGPNYDVEIAADELLTDLAESAAGYGEEVVENRQSWRESWDWASEFRETRYWMLEALGGRRAYATVMAKIQPGGRFRNDDGTVDVRGLMRFVSDRSSEAHERSYGDFTETRQADEAESAYASILSTIRDKYGVGWPRFDDVGGVMERDLP